MAQADWPSGWVRRQLGHEVRDAALFVHALTHRSAARVHNERQEFLGDAVLNLVIAEQLYRRFPQATEGDLSRLRARLVSGQMLARVAAGLGMGAVLRLGSGELKSGGFRRESILADAFEAVCGAVFLDAGFEAARTVVVRLFGPLIGELPGPGALKDPKTTLQELLQSRALPLPQYRVLRCEGQTHAQTFWVACEVGALGVGAHAQGASRRRAEQAAAAAVLAQLGVAVPAREAALAGVPDAGPAEARQDEPEAATAGRHGAPEDDKGAD